MIASHNLTSGHTPSTTLQVQLSTNLRLGELDSESVSLTKGPRSPGGGQHVELLIDNGTDMAMTTNTSVQRQVTPGPHIFYAYACRPDGESYKNPNAVVVLPFVGGSDQSQTPPNGAGRAIIYNLPYRRTRAEAAMLDFVLSNVPFDAMTMRMTAHVVKVYIDDSPPVMLDYWKPCYIKGLTPKTTTKIKLELIDRASNEVVSSTERTIDVMRD